MNILSFRLSIVPAIVLVASLVAGEHASAQAQNAPIADLDPRQQQTLREIGGATHLSLDAAGIPTLIEANLGVVRSDSSFTDADANQLLKRIGGLLRADGTESVAVRKVNTDAQTGKRHYRIRQTIDGMDVVGGEMILHVDESTGRVLSVDMQFLSGAGLPRTAAISANTALQLASQQLSGAAIQQLDAPKLMFLRTADAKGYLVWKIPANYMDVNGVAQVDDLFIDAITGSLVEKHPRIYSHLNRTVKDHNTLVAIIYEGGTTTDSAAINVYNNSAAVYNYFANNYGRHSWDGGSGFLGEGAPMISLVHGTFRGQNQAQFIAGDGTTHYGDGDGGAFGPLTTTDIVAHEWTHGVTYTDAGLNYVGESGALNEAMSDIFGAVVEASITGVTNNTWLIGEGAITPGVSGDALRYMYSPTVDGNSRDYYPELLPTDDVHFGSGIGNLAFYLAVSGGSHPLGKTSITVPAIGISAAARIFYFALRDYLLSNSGYVAARDATARVAKEQYGFGSPQHVSICRAWQAVGLPISTTYCLPSPPANITASDIWACPNSVISWDSVVGATAYQLWRLNNNAIDYVKTYEGAATFKSQSFPINTYATFRASACNSDGCGDKSTASVTVYWVTECP